MLFRSVRAFQITEGKEVLTKVAQTKTVEERKITAQQCVNTLKLSMPILVDRADNQVNRAYSAWPDRLYVVGSDGQIAYKGGPGPKGFRPEEVARWLRTNTAP